MDEARGKFRRKDSALMSCFKNVFYLFILRFHACVLGFLFVFCSFSDAKVVVFGFFFLSCGKSSLFLQSKSRARRLQGGFRSPMLPCRIRTWDLARAHTYTHTFALILELICSAYSVCPCMFF